MSFAAIEPARKELKSGIRDLYISSVLKVELALHPGDLERVENVRAGIFVGDRLSEES